MSEATRNIISILESAEPSADLKEAVYVALSERVQDALNEYKKIVAESYFGQPTDLQEISQNTLKSYRDAAANDKWGHDFAAKHRRDMAKRLKPGGGRDELRQNLVKGAKVNDQKSANRATGLARAEKRIKEENLDEGLVSRVVNAAKNLNKSTQYPKDRYDSSEKRISKRPDSPAKTKALTQIKRKRDWYGAGEEGDMDASIGGSNRGFGHTKAAYGKDVADRSLKRAMTRKEDTDLQEISKKTLGSYVKKSASAYGQNMHAAGINASGDSTREYNTAKKQVATAKKRRLGIERATDRLTKD